jgi:hypothetical protein
VQIESEPIYKGDTVIVALSVALGDGFLKEHGYPKDLPHYFLKATLDAPDFEIQPVTSSRRGIEPGTTDVDYIWTATAKQAGQKVFVFSLNGQISGTTSPGGGPPDIAQQTATFITVRTPHDWIAIMASVGTILGALLGSGGIFLILGNAFPRIFSRTETR